MTLWLRKLAFHSAVERGMQFVKQTVPLCCAAACQCHSVSSLEMSCSSSPSASPGQQRLACDMTSQDSCACLHDRQCQHSTERMRQSGACSSTSRQQRCAAQQHLHAVTSVAWNGGVHLPFLPSSADCDCAVAVVVDLQVPAYLKRNQQTIAHEKQQLEDYIKLREQPVRTAACTMCFCPLPHVPDCSICTH